MENSIDESNELPSPTVLDALKKLLYKKFPNKHFEYKIAKATEKGDNYLGVVFRITINFMPNEQQQQQQQTVFSLILKVPPFNVVRRKQFFARPCFLRESLAYEEFLPLAKKFQEQKGITAIENGFKEYAECFCCLKNELDEAIFMEDLHLRNFQLFDRFEQLNFEHVALIMRIYGKLHAISFAIKVEQQDAFEKFQHMKDIFEQRKDDSQLGVYFEELRKSAFAVLNPATDQFYMQKFEKYFAGRTFFDILIKLVDGKQCEPYAVVCHGDCWNNNILFKHDGQNAIDACLIDWQLMRYASPITDLMYFVFTCTTREFRVMHLNEMLNVYYEELSKHLLRLKSDVKLIFPREVFDEEIRNKSVFGMLMAMIVLPIITTRAEDAPDLEELSERIEGGATTDLKDAGFLSERNASEYRKRMRDTIIDCIDLGYV